MCYLPIINIFMEPVHVILVELDHINVRLVDSFHVSLAWVNAEGRGPVDAGDGYSVSGGDVVHEVIVAIEDNSVWCLTGRHVI